jgi:hypothetical protein
MGLTKKKTLVARSTFVATDNEGVEHFVREGETVSADHPAVKGRELLFAEHDPVDAE